MDRFNVIDTSINSNNIFNIAYYTPIFNATKLNDRNLPLLSNIEQNSFLVYNGTEWILQDGSSQGTVFF